MAYLLQSKPISRGCRYLFVFRTLPGEEARGSAVDANGQVAMVSAVSWQLPTRLRCIQVATTFHVSPVSMADLVPVHRVERARSKLLP